MTIKKRAYRWFKNNGESIHVGKDGEDWIVYSDRGSLLINNGDWVVEMLPGQWVPMADSYVKSLEIEDQFTLIEHPKKESDLNVIAGFKKEDPLTDIYRYYMTLEQHINEFRLVLLQKDEDEILERSRRLEQLGNELLTEAMDKCHPQS